MTTIHIHAETPVPPGPILAALTDFTDRRPDYWPNLGGRPSKPESGNGLVLRVTHHKYAAPLIVSTAGTVKSLAGGDSFVSIVPARTCPTAASRRGGYCYGEWAPFPERPRGARTDRCSYVLSRLSFSGNSVGLLSAGGRTRQGWAAPGGGQALIRSRGQQSCERCPGRPADRSEASISCGSRLAGQAAPGAGGVSRRRAGGGRPRGRRSA